MEISGYSLFGTQELEETERVRRNQGKREKSVLENLGGGEDSVSISDEARSLYAEMRAKQTQEKEDREKQDKEKQNQEEFAKKSPLGKPQNVMDGSDDESGTGVGGVEGAKGGAGGGGGSSSTSSTSSVDAIKKQIEQLQSKLQAIAASSLPDATKTSTIAAYESQINSLQKQLLEAEQASAG